MINERLNSIRAILNEFTGKEGEPGNDNERYILKSLWIMMVSEFEGFIQDAVENYLDLIKSKPSSEIHVCLLLQNFYGDSEDPLTVNKVIGVYKKDSSKITYRNFTRNFKPKNKTVSLESLYNKLGIFFSDSEKSIIKKIDSISSTRDSIAHGDKSVAITRSEMVSRLDELEIISLTLLKKLKPES